MSLEFSNRHLNNLTTIYFVYCIFVEKNLVGILNVIVTKNSYLKNGYFIF